MTSIRTISNLGLATAMVGAIAGSLMLSQTAHGATAADVAKLTGADRTKILTAGAKKEGKVVLYSSMIVNQAMRPLADAFSKKYPFITAEYWRANSRPIITKVTAEVRANALVADVIEGGGVSQALIKIGALQPFSSPSQAAYSKDIIAADGHWTATRFNFFALAHNTKLVSVADAPKSYEDMLNPKWKGKFAWIANSETGSAMLFITAVRAAMGEKKAEAYLTKLAKQKIVNINGSARALVDRVVQGEYPMGINIFAHHPIISARKGASVDTRLLDPVPATASVVMLPKAAPHPHAAMMLIDFLLSEEGQKVLQKANYLPTHPKVDAKSALFPILPSKNGKKAIFLSEEKLFEFRGKSLALQKKYFGK